LWGGLGDAAPRFRERTSEAQPGADGEAATGKGSDGFEERRGEAGVGIAEVVAAGEQFEAGMTTAAIGKPV